MGQSRARSNGRHGCSGRAEDLARRHANVVVRVTRPRENGGYAREAGAEIFPPAQSFPHARRRPAEWNHAKP